MAKRWGGERLGEECSAGNSEAGHRNSVLDLLTPAALGNSFSKLCTSISPLVK